MKLLILLLTFIFFGKTDLSSENIYNINATAISIEKLPHNEFNINKNSLAFERQYPITTKQQNGDKEYTFDFNLFRVAIIFICIGSIMGFIGFCMLFVALARRKKLGRKIKEVRADVAKLPKVQIDRYVNLNEILVGLEAQEKTLKDKNPKKLEEVQAKIQALKKEIDAMKAAAK